MPIGEDASADFDVCRSRDFVAGRVRGRQLQRLELFLEKLLYVRLIRGFTVVKIRK